MNASPRAAGRIPWKAITGAVMWLIDHVRNNLKEKERQELLQLVAGSKGRRTNLTQKEQQRVLALLRKGFLGNGGDR